MNTALVLGGTGTIGTAIIRALHESGEYEIFATTRRAHLAFPAGVKPIQVDLLDKTTLTKTLSELPPISHIFYAALYPHEYKTGDEGFAKMRKQMTSAGFMYNRLGWVPGLKRSLESQFAAASNSTTPGSENEQMLDNVLSVVESLPNSLVHVSLVTGGKVYGMHYSPMVYKGWRTVMREDDPPAPGPSYYFFQENRVIEGAKQHGYHYTISRPPYVIGYAESSGYNILTAIIVYATLLREQGLPLIFPGDDLSAQTRLPWCDANLIGALHEWAAESGRAANQVFNISNGDPCTVKEVWEAVSEAMDMKLEFRPEGFDTTAFMKEGAKLWPEIIKKHGLQETAYSTLTNTTELAGMAAITWDHMYDLSKLRNAGFNHPVDTQASFKSWITTLRQERIIP